MRFTKVNILWVVAVLIFKGSGAGSAAVAVPAGMGIGAVGAMCKLPMGG
jgi:hypothetical protein